MSQQLTQSNAPYVTGGAAVAPTRSLPLTQSNAPYVTGGAAVAPTRSYKMNAPQGMKKSAKDTGFRIAKQNDSSKEILVRKQKHFGTLTTVALGAEFEQLVEQAGWTALKTVDDRLAAASTIAKSFEVWLAADNKEDGDAKYINPDLFEVSAANDARLRKLDASFNYNALEDEAKEDIDFDRARGLASQGVEARKAFDRSFPTSKGLQMKAPNIPGSPADVLYSNIIADLQNLYHQRSNENGQLLGSGYEARANALAAEINGLNNDSAASPQDAQKLVTRFFASAESLADKRFFCKFEPIQSALDDIKDKKVQRAAKGEIELYRFVYLGGLYSGAETGLRETTKDDLLVMMDVSTAMLGTAEKLLKNIANKTGAYGSIGPPKNRMGTFKKATRKILGREKDTAWETLDYVNYPVRADKLCVSIKDIIRGTLIFKSYADMIEQYQELGILFQKRTLFEGVPILGITKATTGFVPDVEGATYRDMKMVVILKMTQQGYYDITKKKSIETFPGVAFEIQFNTVGGVIVKSGHVNKDALNGTKYPQSSYLDDDGYFMATKFMDDCKEKTDETAAKERIEALKENLKPIVDAPTQLYRQGSIIPDAVTDVDWGDDDNLDDGSDNADVLLDKAHAVYKMEKSDKKDNLEKMYQSIYECAYLFDGYDQGKEKDLSSTIKNYVNKVLAKSAPIRP